MVRIKKAQLWNMAPYNLIQVYFIALHCPKHQGRAMMMQAKLSSEMKAYIHQTKEHHIPDYSNLAVHYYLKMLWLVPQKVAFMSVYFK